MACTACSLHDAIQMERHGTPATVIVTEPMQAVVAVVAPTLGLTGYHHVAVPHPLSPRRDDDLRSIAAGAIDALLAQLVPDRP